MISWLSALHNLSQVPYELLALLYSFGYYWAGSLLTTVRYHELFDTIYTWLRILTTYMGFSALIRQHRIIFSANATVLPTELPSFCVCQSNNVGPQHALISFGRKFLESKAQFYLLQHIGLKWSWTTAILTSFVRRFLQTKTELWQNGIR